MPELKKNVLFLSSGNAVRSIFAEAILNQRGARRVRGYSAGTEPLAAPHPMAITFLQSLGHDTSSINAKSCQTFTRPDAPNMDFIFTLCSTVGKGTFPNRQEHTTTADWRIPDPTSDTLNAQTMHDALANTYAALTDRVTLFLGIDFDHLKGADLQARLDAIGRIDNDARMVTGVV